jgi:hypothetical protein
MVGLELVSLSCAPQGLLLGWDLTGVPIRSTRPEGPMSAPMKPFRATGPDRLAIAVLVLGSLVIALVAAIDLLLMVNGG